MLERVGIRLADDGRVPIDKIERCQFKRANGRGRVHTCPSRRFHLRLSEIVDNGRCIEFTSPRRPYLNDEDENTDPTELLEVGLSSIL